jgi:hypothetical protein
MENQTRSDFFVGRVNVGSCFLVGDWVDLGMSQYILYAKDIGVLKCKKNIHMPIIFSFIKKKERYKW